MSLEEVFSIFIIIYNKTDDSHDIAQVQQIITENSKNPLKW